MKSWAPENFGAFHTVSVDFFVDRKPHDLAQLRQIECPVHLIHCGGDVAYPLHYVEELRSRLASAGLQPRVSQVKDAPHFGNVTHSEEWVAVVYLFSSLRKILTTAFYSNSLPRRTSPFRINDLLHDWVMEHSDGPIPRAKSFVKSPFADDLAKCGHRQNGESDSEDDLVPLWWNTWAHKHTDYFPSWKRLYGCTHPHTHIQAYVARRVLILLSIFTVPFFLRFPHVSPTASRTLI